ncbi:hypothetical protein M404DRAFT_915729 [Pisolithus tinctorius Marx 270]|uniref:Uncharacterized protein n=1 Tax=Pisolithus tinctorius Marx 270 TaxID=870435 RepID=A0A0C3NPC9_PISTI|nr:hypothetical protein M404DRAFT_384022 [Pisolithus tinctorius Marx 270]KIN97158.1 hypothetical protein M404DRAFT_915729 [Pisolithus tinctorius Marx 270]
MSGRYMNAWPSTMSSFWAILVRIPSFSSLHHTFPQKSAKHLSLSVTRAIAQPSLNMAYASNKDHGNECELQFPVGKWAGLRRFPELTRSSLVCRTSYVVISRDYIL